MITSRTLKVHAPAKINLGLEVLGKRDDGYHEIATIMATVGLVDTLQFTPVPDRPGTTISGVPGVPPGSNIIRKAVEAFTQETGIRPGYEVMVEKRIPSPGGLGGASSDAASTLMALNTLHGNPVPSHRMFALASGLGSDVPFFLGAPVALATGTGTTLEPLASIEGHIVLIVPRIDVTSKTARLYAALDPMDFTDGSRVSLAAQMIQAGWVPDPTLIRNSFTRSLYRLIPGLRDLAAEITRAGATHVALSGAGPAHYVLFQDEPEARSLEAALTDRLPQETFIRTLPVGPQPDWPCPVDA